jgi:hypothetical protein
MKLVNTNIKTWKRLLEKAKHTIPITIYNHPQWEPVDKVNILNIGQLSNCEFIGTTIQNHAALNITSCWKVTKNLTIFVTEPTKHKASAIAYACLVLMKFLEYINQNKDIDSPAVVLLLLDIPKTYNSDSTESLATVDNINSGAYFTLPHTILIWRLEEILKVLVHEHVHAYQWDSLTLSNRYLRWFHQHAFNLTTESACNPREALTEVITTIIVSSLDAITNHVPFNVEYKKHMSWSMQQAWFVWRNMKRNKDERVSQNTDVLSYYVIKCFLIHLADFKEEFKEGMLSMNDESVHSVLKELRKAPFWDYMSSVEYEHKGNLTSLRMSPPGTLEQLLCGSPLYQDAV